ncbi:MAG: nucleotidyltransferase family protein [Acidimicrobiales bacterium]|nr:nucleotidyltransferase family protein [Acidimicrobiales bacterium]
MSRSTTTPLRTSAGALSDPDRLLLRAALGQPGEALAAWEHFRPSFDFEGLNGEHYRLAPLLGWNLERAGLTSADDADLARLLGLTRRTWVQSQRHLAVFGDVSDRLAAAGVTAVAIKGAAMLHLAYPELGLRPMEDLDIVVRYGDVGRAEQALASVDAHQAHVASDGHAAQWVMPGGIEVDLHTQLNPWMIEAPGGPGMAAVHRHAIAVELPDGRSVMVADPADQLLVTFLHGIRGSSARLRWMADAVWLVRGANLDWDYFAAQADRFAVTGLAIRAAEFARDATATSVVPAEVIERMRANGRSVLDRLTLAAMDYDRFPNVGRTAVFDLHSLPPGRRLAKAPTVVAQRLGADSPVDVVTAAARRVPAYLWSSLKGPRTSRRRIGNGSWKPDRVLVTGADGPTGWRVSDQLESRSRQVVRVDRSAGLDVRRPAHVHPAVEGCDAIVHLASIPWNASWKSSLATNVWGTLVVARAARRAKVKRVVYVSSFQVTGAFMGRGAPVRLPFDERHPKRPPTPYAYSKLWAEYVCRLLCVLDRSVSVVVVRPPAVWEDDRFERDRLKWEADETRQWRPFWEYGAFIHVDDLTDLLVRAVEEPLATGFEEVTVSGPDSASLWPTWDLVQHLHPDVAWRSGRDRDAVKAQSFAPLVDSSRARALFGWSPSRAFHGHHPAGFAPSQGQ